MNKVSSKGDALALPSPVRVSIEAAESAPSINQPTAPTAPTEHRGGGPAFFASLGGRAVLETLPLARLEDLCLAFGVWTPRFGFIREIGTASYDELVAALLEHPLVTPGALWWTLTVDERIRVVASVPGSLGWRG